MSRAVAATLSPRSRAAIAHSRPKPRDAPVMNQVRVLMSAPAAGRPHYSRNGAPSVTKPGVGGDLVLRRRPAATAATVPSTQLSGLRVAQPSTVCGFSQHALDRMASRGISPLDVRMAVALGADPAFRNSHDNWQYESSGLIVTMNEAGCVVTAMYR